MSIPKSECLKEKKKLPTGELLTMDKTTHIEVGPTAVYTVSMWNSIGECRWSLDFYTLEKAEIEYKRWEV